MAVVNTTYNFNQPNMNLGECIGYGILGSLTGNMGMYGGYGFGGFGGFGMGGSIFPMGTMMGGYGCCGYGIGGYSNSFAGMQLGNAFAGIALNCLTQAIGGGRGGSSKQTISSQIDDVESKASSNLDKLDKGTTLSNFNPNKKASEYTVVTDLQDNIDKLDGTVNAKKEEYKNTKNQFDLKFPSEPKRSDSIYEYDYKKYLNAVDINNPTDAEISKAKEDAKKAADAQFLKDKETYRIEKEKVDKLEEELKTLETELNEAKSTKEAKEKEVQAAIDALKPLKEEYDKLIKTEKAEKEAEVYDDADGNWLNRASKSSIEKYNGGECTKAQVRKAFNLFIEAKNSGKTDDAKNWANKIVTMHKNNENLFDNNFATAYKQVTSWLDDNQ